MTEQTKTKATADSAAGFTDDDYLTADDILGANDIDYIDEVVPEWVNPRTGKPGVVRLVAFSAADAMKYTKEGRASEDALEASYVRMFRDSAVNPKTGALLFPDIKSVEQLKKKKSGIFLRLQRKMLILNGQREPEKQMEAAKND